MSCASSCPRCATLTLAVRQPAAFTRSRARSGSTAGTVTFTGTASRAGPGQPTVAASTAHASQRAHSAGPYSGNGENSPQPAGPWMSAPVRTVTPPNGVRIGIANARSPPMRSATNAREAEGPVPAAAGKPAPPKSGRRFTGPERQQGRSWPPREPGEVRAALLPERVAPLLRLLAHVVQQGRVARELLHARRAVGHRVQRAL